MGGRGRTGNYEWRLIDFEVRICGFREFRNIHCSDWIFGR